MCSLVEGKAKRLAKAEPKDFVRYNKRQISRIYPAGIRADSRYVMQEYITLAQVCVHPIIFLFNRMLNSNYDPVTMWACGCQMVALVCFVLFYAL